MPCAIALTAVNGIVQAGQVDPSVLRVTGTASQCSSVVVTSPLASGSATVPVDPTNGRFRAELTITASPAPACGDTVLVRAECVGDPACAAQQQRPLACCEIPTLFFQGATPLGSLTPNQLLVQGTIHGCPSDQVVISSSVTATTGPITVDPYTGSFSALIPTSTPIQCDDVVTVTVACATGAGCTRTEQGKLACPGCYRASVTVAAAPCTGTPPQQPITLDANIAIPAGRVQDFYWSFGDGSNGPHFTIDNSAGTAATSYQHTETHPYAPGTYTATLKIVPPPYECWELTVTVVAQCATGGCPTISVDPPQVAGQCVNGKRTVTLTSHITTAAGQTAVVQWDYGDTTNGPASVVAPGSTLNDVHSHDYPPGTYTATLKTVLPQGCPDKTVQVVVQPCTTPPCTLVVQGLTLQVGPCDAAGNRTVSATGSVNNSDPADLYYWQWDANPAQVGLPAAQGGTQQHAYAAPGAGQSTYDITLTVIRSGTCVSSLTKTVTIDGCGGGCPQITNASTDAPGICTADRLHRRVTLDATINGSGVSQYVWDFGDTSTATLPGSAGPQTTHDYAPGTYNVNLKAVGPGSCEANFPLQIVVDKCCPELTDITVAPGTCPAGATTRPVTLTAQVAGAGAATFDWDFGDGSPTVTTTTPAAPTHNYAAPGSFTAAVTVHAPNCTDASFKKAVSVAACTGSGTVGSGGGMGLPSCAALLWAAIIFLLVGAIVTVVGCILMHFFPQAGLIVEIIGIVIAAIGAILFLIWWIVCRLFTACPVILAVRAFVMVLIGVFAGIAVVLAILAIFFADLWACAGAATVYSAAWGGILAMLDWIAQDRGCLTLNPAGGSSGSSSGALTSSEGTRRLELSDFSRMSVQKPAGLGDVVKSATAAMGIQPCGKCHERAERLNARFPFGSAPTPEIAGPAGTDF